LIQEAPRPIKIGILETGRPPEAFRAQFGNYAQMVRSWLNLPDAEFESYAVLDGEFPPAPAQCDVWAITGSRCGVYEAHSWIPPLEDFIRACRDNGVKMVGICFGHQIIAQALGGTVRKSEKGWGLGVHEYPTRAWPQEIGTQPQVIAIQAWHQDQVEAPPADARVVASSAFCPNAALYYPGFAVTFQGHPEFSGEFAGSLIKDRRGHILSDKEAGEGLATVDNPSNRAELARLVGSFIRTD
jgi:GMP synthase-like glutamine amidotransferase